MLPDGRTLNTLTYGSGHVHQINLDFRTICDFERDALHREVGRSQGALFTQYSLDPLGRLLQSQARLQREAAEPLAGQGAQASPASQGQRIARRYQYDLAGQLTTLADRRQGVTQYGYDALGRLRAALSPRGEELFAFDPAHNLMEPEQARREEAKARKTQWTEEEWSAYVQANLDNPAFNPLLTPAEAASDPSAWGERKPNRLRVWREHRYAYDAWGNCIEKKSGPNQVRRFDWDADHQLSRATIEKRNGRFVHVERWGYDYDPFGRRIAKYRLDRNSTRSPRPWQDPDATHFAWDGNRLLLERRGGRQSLYLYEPDSFVPLALVRSEVKTPVPEDDIPLPAEWLALKDLHPEHWATTTGAMQRKIETKRQARRARLGLADEAPFSSWIIGTYHQPVTSCHPSHYPLHQLPLQPFDFRHQAGHAQVVVGQAGLEAEVEGVARVAKAVGVGEAFVVEGVVFGEAEVGGGKAVEGARQQGRGAPVLVIGRVGQVVAVEPVEGVGFQQVAFRVAVVGGVSVGNVGDGVEQDLGAGTQGQGGGAMAGVQGEHGRQGGADAVAAEGGAGGFESEAAALFGQPVGAVQGVQHRRRERPLRGQPVVQGEDRAVACPGQAPAQRVVGVEAANHVAAAVEVQQHGLGIGGAGSSVQARLQGMAVPRRIAVGGDVQVLRRVVVQQGRGPLEFGSRLFHRQA